MIMKLMLVIFWVCEFTGLECENGVLEWNTGVEYWSIQTEFFYDANIANQDTHHV